jgi:hypothetical protein
VVRLSSPSGGALRSGGRPEIQWRGPRGWRAVAGSTMITCSGGIYEAQACRLFIQCRHLLLLPRSTPLSFSLSLIWVLPFSHRSHRRRPGVLGSGMRWRQGVGGVQRRPSLFGVLVMARGG